MGFPFEGGVSSGGVCDLREDLELHHVGVRFPECRHPCERHGCVAHSVVVPPVVVLHLVVSREGRSGVVFHGVGHEPGRRCVLLVEGYPFEVQP